MGFGEEEDGGHGENGEMELDDDDDEDEDVDFNPFLRDSPSEEKDSLASEGDANTMRKERELLDQTMDALPDLNISRKQVIHVQNGPGNEEEDDENAICRSLDELEMFLQESDEEDYFQNVDDEEEYRKFLAAVIGNPDADGEGNQEANRKEDIEDDADFEMEIEPALESDPDESWGQKSRKEKSQVSIHRPETRQKKR